MIRRIRQTDAKTGEELDGFVAYVVPKRQNGFVEGWCAMAQRGGLGVLKQFTRIDDLRVVLALLEKLDYENLIIASQSEIARDLGMHRQHVSGAIKRLIEAGAILKGPRVGINCSYRLNPNFGWKGSAKGHVEALDDYRKERMKTAKVTGALEGKETEAEPTKDSE